MGADIPSASVCHSTSRREGFMISEAYLKVRIQSRVSFGTAPFPASNLPGPEQTKASSAPSDNHFRYGPPAMQPKSWTRLGAVGFRRSRWKVGFGLPSTESRVGRLRRGPSQVPILQPVSLGAEIALRITE